MDAGAAQSLQVASHDTDGVIGLDRIASDPGLASAWQRLEEAATLPTQSHAFAAALACRMLSGRKGKVFFAGHGDRFSALLPMCREPGYLSRWRIAGAREVFEPFDALCANRQAAEELANAMLRQPRALLLHRLPAQSPLLPALRRAARGKAFLRVQPATPCPTISLGERWRQPHDCFNSGRRSDFRRAARKADALGAVSYEVLSPDPQQFDALFDEAIAVEMRSWKREAGSAIASDPAKEAFFRDWLRSAAGQGIARIAFLRIAGKPAAMQLAVEWHQRFWLFKIGYDEDYAKCSPGTLLMLHTLGHAASRGLVAYELLGDLEPWIVEFWTRDQHDCISIASYPFNLRGTCALATDAFAFLRARLDRWKR